MNPRDTQEESLLSLMARAEIERRRRDRLSEPLLEFIPRISPRWLSPRHLKPITDLIERTAHEKVFAVINVPPRHGKTETILHGLAQRLSKDPTVQAGYATYDSNLAKSKSRLARDYSVRAGVKLRPDSKALDEWLTTAGGGMIATGVGGPLTGRGAGVLVVDDPHKNRQEAESACFRSRVWDWFTSTALTRLTPDGSCIVVHTRWHEDDLGGRCIKMGWEHINLPAIAEVDEPSGRRAGEALWPEGGWDLKALLELKDKIGPYDWASLYQGQPRPRGAGLFEDVHFYDDGALPTSGYELSIGLDLAYTAKTTTDASVIVVMMRYENVFFILDVLRVHERATTFKAILDGVCRQFPGVDPFWYCNGPEIGVAELIADQLGICITAKSSNLDKYAKAQPLAAAWNNGKVLVPKDRPWVAAYVSEMRAFTGIADPADDQVDATVSAFDRLADSNLVVPYTGVRRIRSARA